MSHRLVAIMLTCTVALTAAACGSDQQASTVDTSPGLSATPSAATPTTVRPSTTAPLATTTSTATAPTTVAAPAGSAWSPVDRQTVDPKVFPPCCADTWHGAASPPLAPEGEQLVDGDYAVTMHWPDDLSQPLQLEVTRFEQCELLPEFACESQQEPYQADQLGVDVSASRLLSVPLDDTVGVVMVGWDPTVVDGDALVVEQATGTELAALANEVDGAYDVVFASRFLAGEDPDAIVTDVVANPTGGFVPTTWMETLVFVPTTGPPIMFQGIFPVVNDTRASEPDPNWVPVREPGRGVDHMWIKSIQVVEGQITLHVYAGYVP